MSKNEDALYGGLTFVILFCPLLGWLGIITFRFLNSLTNEFLTVDFLLACGFGLVLVSLFLSIMQFAETEVKISDAIAAGVLGIVGAAMMLANQLIK